jgi:dTDP-4-amino-4,6-dideoxygalactose transaminase
MMVSGKGIPFVDLVTPHLELQEELLQAAKNVLASGMFVGGPVVEQFEQDFARFCDTEYCVGVSSGTDALRFVLMAAGIGKDDVVVTVPNTFVATVEAIIQAGAVPHFVDIDPQTFNMSVDALREYLQTRDTTRVKAILPVHLYGQMCDMDPLMRIAEEYGLMVFEDACQAHGSEYFSAKNNRWQKAGSVGKAAAFSFYPGKNLGACGEAGAVTTNDESIAQRIRMIRDHGQNMKYHHLIEGYNGRLDALQAALLDVKLRFLDDWNSKRRQAAKTYNELLAHIPGINAPFEPSWSRAIYHLYVIVCERRDELQQHLSQRKIGTGLHYPIPLHLQRGYTNLGYRPGDFPITEAMASKILSLPIFPQLTEAQQRRVGEALSEFYETSSAPQVSVSQQAGRSIQPQS